MNVRTVKLSEIAETTSGGTPQRGVSRFYGGKIPWVKSGELNDGYIIETEEFLTEEGLKNSSAKLFPAGTLLIAMYGATVGRLGILEMPASTNQAVCAITSSPELDRDYLFFHLLKTRDKLVKASFGGAQPNISQAFIRDLEIPLPSLDKQRRIAAQLKAQLVAVEEARQAAQAQAREAEALEAAIYRETFQAIVPVAVPPEFEDAPAGWRWAKLAELARLESGHTPSRIRPDWWGGDISWVSLTEIRALDGRWTTATQIKTNTAGIKNSSARVLPRGTVCFSRTASVGFVTLMAEPMATSQDFANWVCGDGLDPEFLMYALIRARSELRALATGATHKTIYMPTLEAFHLCAPDRATQERLVQRLKTQLEAVQDIRQGTQQRLAEIERLPARLLAQAFGEG
jgi:type I restriction enzyme S subunit